MFTAPWCKVCPIVHPIAEEVSKEQGIEFSLIDAGTEEGAEQSVIHSIMSLPTLILFKDGAEVARRSNLISKADLTKLVKLV